MNIPNSGQINTQRSNAKVSEDANDCLVSAVDCWDGQDGEPIVHHGYTLTSKILFKDVIETINKYAFVKNR